MSSRVSSCGKVRRHKSFEREMGEGVRVRTLRMINLLIFLTTKGFCKRKLPITGFRIINTL